MTKAIEALYSLTYEEREAIMNAAVNVDTVVIKPAAHENMMTYRTGGLQNLSATQIINVLGMKPNVEDDPDKVVNSWQFTINGNPCAIWDYRGSHYAQMWSVYDPSNSLTLLFGKENFQ